MESQAKNESPPPPPDISATLRGLNPGETHLFPADSATSVRTLAARIGKELGWSFKTKRADGGIRVWRKTSD